MYINNFFCDLWIDDGWLSYMDDCGWGWGVWVLFDLGFGIFDDEKLFNLLILI